jgi:hypothetical protein
MGFRITTLGIVIADILFSILVSYFIIAFCSIVGSGFLQILPKKLNRIRRSAVAARKYGEVLHRDIYFGV